VLFSSRCRRRRLSSRAYGCPSASRGRHHEATVRFPSKMLPLGPATAFTVPAVTSNAGRHRRSCRSALAGSCRSGRRRRHSRCSGPETPCQSQEWGGVAIGAALWVQLAQPSVLVHRVNPSMSQMVSSPRKATGYGAARFPLLEVQQVRQLDPSVTRSRDPVRSQPPVAVRCIWSTYSWSARAGRNEPGTLGLGDCGGVEFEETGEV